MKIIGGRHRGRRLKAPKGLDLRPTSGRTREAVFNILAHGIDGLGGFDFSGTSVVDLFCGTGALGLEALSRGAGRVVLVDRERTALALARENAETLGEGQNVTLLQVDAARLPPPPLAAGAPCRLAFLDAPYNRDLTGPALWAMANTGWVDRGAVIVAEVAEKETLEPPPGFDVFDERIYGPARVVFLRYRA